MKLSNYLSSALIVWSCLTLVATPVWAGGKGGPGRGGAGGGGHSGGGRSGHFAGNGGGLSAGGQGFARSAKPGHQGGSGFPQVTPQRFQGQVGQAGQAFTRLPHQADMAQHLGNRLRSPIGNGQRLDSITKPHPHVPEMAQRHLPKLDEHWQDAVRTRLVTHAGAVDAMKKLDPHVLNQHCERAFRCAPHFITNHNHCHWWFRYVCGNYFYCGRPWVCTPAYWETWIPCTYYTVQCQQVSYYVGMECVLIPDIQGLGVQAVQAGSPAEQAGIQVGDMILSVNGRSLTNEAVLKDEIPRGPMVLQVLRDGSETPLEIVVTPRRVATVSY